MRVLSLATLSAFLATSSLAAPSPSAAPTVAKRSVDVPDAPVLPLPPTPIGHFKRHLTNAERLASGLPLNPPHRRNGMHTMLQPWPARPHSISQQLVCKRAHLRPPWALRLTLPLPVARALVRAPRAPASSRSLRSMARSLATLRMLPLASASTVSPRTRRTPSGSTRSVMVLGST